MDGDPLAQLAALSTVIKQSDAVAPVGGAPGSYQDATPVLRISFLAPEAVDLDKLPDLACAHDCWPVDLFPA